jgi:hypothetical protein
MMLVETDAVIAEAVQLFPGGKVLGVSADGDLRPEITFRQRIGQLAADLQMIELLAISQQVEDKDLHRVLPKALLPALLAAEHSQAGGSRQLRPPSWTT